MELRELYRVLLGTPVEEWGSLEVEGLDLEDPLLLHRAIRETGKEVVVRFVLMRQGGLRDLPDGEGWHPQHLAVMSRNPLVVRALAEAGADFNVEGPGGVRPLDLALDEGRWPKEERDWRWERTVAELLMAGAEAKGGGILGALFPPL